MQNDPYRIKDLRIELPEKAVQSDTVEISDEARVLESLRETLGDIHDDLERLADAARVDKLTIHELRQSIIRKDAVIAQRNKKIEDLKLENELLRRELNRR